MKKTDLMQKIGPRWRIHTPNLLEEIANNTRDSQGIAMPLAILGKVLYEVGECASRINDPELNSLMARLTIYSVADPKSEDYNEEIAHKLMYV